MEPFGRKQSPPSFLKALQAAFSAALMGAFLWTCGGGQKMQKAVWVVRDEIAAEDGPAKIQREAVAAGLDALLIQVRGRGDAYYASRVAPRAEALEKTRDDYDPLAEMLKLDGTQIIAWLNVYYLWGGDAPPKSPIHPATAHPQWLLRDADGKSVADYTPVERGLGWIEGIYADPASPGYRDHFAALVRELVENYDIDGIHLDFIRYPGPGYGQSGALGNFFTKAWGIDPMFLPEEFRSPDVDSWLSGEMPEADRVLASASLLWADLRAAQITSLVGTVKGVMESIRPGLKLSAAVFPDPGEAFLQKGQDWRTWISLGLMEELYPMVYFGGEERVTSQLESIASLLAPQRRSFQPSFPTYGKRLKLWAGLGAFIKEPDAIAAEAKTAARLGYDGVCLFDLGGMRKNQKGVIAFTNSIERRLGTLHSMPNQRYAAAPKTSGGQRLSAIVERASGGAPLGSESLNKTLGDLLDERWAEFEQRGTAAMANASDKIKRGKWPVPQWLDMKGVFRYVHPNDGEARVAEQRKIIEEARIKALAREDFAAVAEQYSRGGTRSLGGELRRRYLFSNSEADLTIDETLAKLKVGEISPIIEVSNGFWFYKIEAKGNKTLLPADQIPWPVKRRLFRSLLAEELKSR